MNEDVGTFQDEEINFETAWLDARKLMGLRTTDLELLYYNTGLLYLNAPDKWQNPYLVLLDEIHRRIEISYRMSMGMYNDK